MSFINKLALFLCVTAFSGSMVVMGARDMRNALKAPTPPEMERAKKLIQQLRGDELFRIEAKYNETHEKPARKPGSVLPDYDLAKIKKFLSNMIGGVGTDVAEDPDAASKEGEK
jgi:hypothetical protein